MYAIILQQLIVQRDTFHEKLDPLHAQIRGHLSKDGFEFRGISRPVVAGYADSEQHNGGAGRFCPHDDLFEIRLHPRCRNTAQTVVAAQFQNDQPG